MAHGYRRKRRAGPQLQCVLLQVGSSKPRTQQRTHRLVARTCRALLHASRTLAHKESPRHRHHHTVIPNGLFIAAESFARFVACAAAAAAAAAAALVIATDAFVISSSPQCTAICGPMARKSASSLPTISSKNILAAQSRRILRVKCCLTTSPGEWKRCVPAAVAPCPCCVHASASTSFAYAPLSACAQYSVRMLCRKTCLVRLLCLGLTAGWGEGLGPSQHSRA